MTEKTQRKRDILRDQVVAQVVEFVNQEGGISQSDLYDLFGDPLRSGSVALALFRAPLNFSQGS